jgi:hypothetical protein
MAKRYVIMGYMYLSDREVPVCEVDKNPDEMVKALYGKTLRTWTGEPGESKRSNISKYAALRIVDREAKDAQS